MLEIVSPEWQYAQGNEGDFERILQVKEQRRLGTSRWGTCTPQAPAIVVRLPKSSMPSTRGDVCVRAELWSFGPSFKGKNIMNQLPPDAKGSALSKLRANTYITCTENVEKFDDDKGDDYVYAKLKCFVTRGARVFCRKNHVALRLSVVLKDAGSLIEVESIPWVRTARLSISEKAMCPRESDRKRKAPELTDHSPQGGGAQAGKKRQRETPVTVESNVSPLLKGGPLPQSLVPPSMLPYILQPELFLAAPFSATATNLQKRSASEKLRDDLLSQTHGVLMLQEPLLLHALSGRNAKLPMGLLYPPSSLFS